MLVAEKTAPTTTLMIFTKAPIPGLVKTRLQPPLSAVQAAQLQRLLIRHSLQSLQGLTGVRLELWVSPDIDHAFFCQLAAEFPLSLHRQSTGDLGQRMASAFTHHLIQPGKILGKVLVIGTDCPQINLAYIYQALDLLEQNDAVIGPALDGGYVLLGLKRIHPLIFENIHWSTPQVLAQTRQGLMQAGFSWQELTPLTDIDRPEDLSTIPQLMAQLTL